MSAISFIMVKDNVSPALKRLSDPALITKATLAAGTALLSLSTRAFDEPGLRAAPWPQRKPSKATNPLLIKSGTLRQSGHVEMQGADTVKVGYPPPYAAVHQLGSSKSSGRGSGIPPRPFFPVISGELTGTAAELIGDAVDVVIRGAALG